MSLVACSCYVLHCDRCGAALSDEGMQLHFTDSDPAGESLVEVAEGCGWTSDGAGWHCEDCPWLASVCELCRTDQHSLCEDPDCSCALQALTPGQGTLPFGEGPDA